MSRKPNTPASAAFTLDERPGPSGQLTLVWCGRLDNQALGPGLSQAKGLIAARRPREMVMDLSGVSYLDGAGALLINLTRRAAAQAGAEVQFSGVPAGGEGLLELADPRELDKEPLISSSRGLGFFNQVGEAVLEVVQDLKDMVAFLGSFAVAAYGVLRDPARLRLGDVAYYMERVGVDGLPIVGLVSLLLGLIMAFMSSLQLASFGANIYVADLVALAMVRELGPIMTAILVAGRSGSAFAAEIGTMMVNEEVDALTVMGYDPLSFLVLPKALAAVIVIPLLTLYSDVLGILGGLVVGVTGLDLTLYSYIKETGGALSMFGVVTGIIKAVVFAVIIAGVGCQRGFTVRGGAQGVGTATTSAVVTAMFIIIVTDAVFAIVLSYVE